MKAQLKKWRMLYFMKKSMIVLLLAVVSMFMFAACNPTDAASSDNASSGNTLVSGGNIALPGVSAGNAN